jgi:beta-1,4-N-acetylglucosaminyltransferase
VLGSGGHTAEMMSLLRDLDPRRYIHRTYIVSSGDNFSSSKAQDIERLIQSNHSETLTEPGEFEESTGVWDVKIVSRARKIHQPLYTAPFSCLWCLVGCLRALRDAARTSRVGRGEYPDVLITNGPATAVIFLISAYMLQLLGLAPASKMRTIYVESWARVRTLSLSGKVIMYLGLSDRFLVQWEALAARVNKGREKALQRAEWLGFLVE